MIPCVSHSAITELQAAPAIIETMSRQTEAYSISLLGDTEWREFLWKLWRPSGLFEEEHIRAVALLWDSLNKKLLFPLPLPLTQPTVNGNIQLAWDAGRYYLEIEIRKDFKLEWFFRDRETNQLDGTEDNPESTVSPALFARLGYFLN